MKIKLLVILFCIFTLVLSAFSQSVTVTPKKTIYKRPQPIADYKKSFSVIRPKVSGGNAAIAKKIEAAISYEKVFETFNLKEEIGEYQWLEEADFSIDYNKKGVLVATLFLDGSGAYPSIVKEPVIVNLKTGARVSASDVFIKLPALTAKAKQKQRAEIKQSIVEIKKEMPEETNPATLFENDDFTTKNLDRFYINDKGVTFWYDYGFPHAILSMQPSGTYFFSWRELKPFIKPGGLLAKFVR